MSFGGSIMPLGGQVRTSSQACAPPCACAPRLCVHALDSFKPLKAHICPLRVQLCSLGSSARLPRRACPHFQECASPPRRVRPPTRRARPSHQAYVPPPQACMPPSEACAPPRHACPSNQACMPPAPGVRALSTRCARAPPGVRAPIRRARAPPQACVPSQPGVCAPFHKRACPFLRRARPFPKRARAPPRHVRPFAVVRALTYAVFAL
jgi:hypothetical protein